MHASINGIINFHKPPGMTSHDGVNLLRRLTGIKKIGHTGTLDPMASGVLPLCIGRATRIVEYLAEDDKTYLCEFKLGLKSDTLDIWGDVKETDWDNWNTLSADLVGNTVSSFVGNQTQIPPAYSAVKINGRKLYEYARAGKPVSAPPRTIAIHNISIKQIDMATRLITMEVACSKGTYIRSLCGGIGDKLGCGAVMSGLVRTASGMFSIENSLTVEELTNAFTDGTNPPLQMLTATDAPLKNFPAVVLDGADINRFTNGVKVEIKQLDMPDGLCRVYAGEDSRIDRQSNERGAFLGIGRFNAGVLSAKKVLV